MPVRSGRRARSKVDSLFNPKNAKVPAPAKAIPPATMAAGVVHEETSARRVRSWGRHEGTDDALLGIGDRRRSGAAEFHLNRGSSDDGDDLLLLGLTFANDDLRPPRSVQNRGIAFRRKSDAPAVDEEGLSAFREVNA